MKFGKLAGLLAVVGVSVSLCACGAKSQPDEGDTAENTSIFQKIDSEKSAAAEESDSPAEEVSTQIVVEAEEVSSQDTEKTNESTEEISADEQVTDDAGEAVSGEETEQEGNAASEGGDEVASEGSSDDVSVDVAPADDTTAENTLGNGFTASYDLQTLQNMHYSDEQMEQIRQFYENTVFAGDSVLLGFRNYSARSSDPMLTQLQFLAAGSLSLHNAFWPVSEKSVHPLYQGAQHPIWESMQMMGAKKAFLFFGINDVSYDIDESVALYPQLVDKIRELSPDMEINIISATYTLKDLGKGKLNNTNIAAFNQAVHELANQNGWGYIDMATVLSDGQGNLLPEYCSDGFLHESKSAYNVWTQMLVRYAAERLGLQETPVDDTAQQ
ncbi:GDSL-like Lipase/Acylhydrolase family protein [Butyrivibrio sp. ob235]|uniref:GDSL-type esterase/lipase family protein n=1 Tax=Butyrivibrio sp. ob235 TaxID=1761780 RepID=UPI0008CE82F1|nr:GDSL-type esterase/lipase family protein [Butyrivibrio sp. ob235]SEM08304.1 GDSL-like Lipase/Acylhydrolase family protein [Butyrivibrio sp. ob235]